MFRLALLILAVIPINSHATTKLKINSSTTGNPVLLSAANHFNKKGWQVEVDTKAGNSRGVALVAEGLTDLAMLSRPVSLKDREKYPSTVFRQHLLGFQGTALVVSEDLYSKGVKTLTHKQIKDIYEGKIKNWQQVGGPDRKVTFFNNKLEGGLGKVFVSYLYGDPNKALKVSHPNIGPTQKAATKVSQSKGGITQMTVNKALSSQRVKVVAINEGNRIIPPNLETISDGSYPLGQPLLLLSKAKMSPAQNQFIQFIQSPKGQKIVKAKGYLPIEKMEE